MSAYIPVKHDQDTYWAHSPSSWGPYHNETWCSPGGINHPKVQLIIGTIRQNAHLFEGRSVFIGGGLLQPWHSWDIDLYIEGGWTPGSKQMSEWCVSLGFQHQLFMDVKLVSKFADVRVWQDTRKVETFTTLVFSNQFKNREGFNSLQKYTPYKDMFATQQTIPFEKNITMDKLGFVYEYGIQIL